MTAERVGVTNFPLYWPTGRARWKNQRWGSGFRQSNVYRETQEVRRELELLGARNVIVSSNLQLRQDGIPYAGQKAPQDPGVAVWFDLKGEQHALCCDAWGRADENLRTIAKHISAMRGQLRWKVATAQEAFAGFKALPSGTEKRPWWEVLGCRRNASAEEVSAYFKAGALIHHPDRGGDPGAWNEFEAARSAALKEIG